MKKFMAFILFVFISSFCYAEVLTDGGSVNGAPAYRDSKGRGVQPVVIVENTSNTYSARTNYYFSTSGTTTITASGNNFLYNITVYASTVTGSKISFFDGTTTKTTVSGVTSYQYIYPNGIAFTGKFAVTIVGNSFDGAVSFETNR